MAPMQVMKHKKDQKYVEAEEGPKVQEEPEVLEEPKVLEGPVRSDNQGCEICTAFFALPCPDCYWKLCPRCVNHPAHTMHCIAMNTDSEPDDPNMMSMIETELAEHDDPFFLCLFLLWQKEETEHALIDR